MRKSPAPTLGCADNRALNVVGDDGGRIYGRPQHYQVLTEIEKNSHEAFRLVRALDASMPVLELQLVAFDRRGGAAVRQSFAFGEHHLPKLRALLAVRTGEAS